MPELLGLVVLFHPDEGVAERIKSYLNEVSRLLVVDNSEPPSQIAQVLTKLDPRVEVIINTTNKGVAYALNQGLEYGTRNGFSWLLTMDQDSTFAPGALQLMKKFLEGPNPPAILTPVQLIPGDPWVASSTPTTTLKIAMTSGNILNLSVSTQCGPFEERLFIDAVDHEYCLRVRRQGYRILRVNNAVLHHNLGEQRHLRVFSHAQRIISHPASRRYYMTRNRLFVIRKYIVSDPLVCLGEIWELVKAFFVVSLFESDKSSKLGAMVNGAWHFIRGRYGKVAN